MARDGTETVWVEVKVLRRSQFKDSWEVRNVESQHRGWVHDDKVIDVDGPDMEAGITTKIELNEGYAERLGIA